MATNEQTPAADAGPVQWELGALPEPAAVHCYWRGDNDSASWDQWHDDSDPMPDEWEDDEAPDEVTPHYTADQMRAYGKSERMAGVRSAQEQTAVIVRAALELLEAVEGETPFTTEAARAFKRVFGV